MIQLLEINAGVRFLHFNLKKGAKSQECYLNLSYFPQFLCSKKVMFLSPIPVVFL